MNTDICANRHGGNQQSQSANARTNKERDAEEILGLMKFWKSDDFTCQEASEILKMPYTTASARYAPKYAGTKPWHELIIERPKK